MISVGNIAFGGRAKTAFVEYLADRLDGIAILTRGYRSKMEHQSPTIIDSTTDPKVCGDEPALLARLKSQPIVVVGKNRCEGAKIAEKAGAKVIVLDDGFQHRYLMRDLNVVMISSEDLEGTAFLRESPKALRRADLIVVIGECSDERIAQFSDAPVAGVKYVLPQMNGEKMAAFCALGSPKQFFESLQTTGAEVVSTLSKRDHAAFSQTELLAFCEKAQGAQKLVCTRKDAIKLEKFPLPLPIEIIDAKLEFTFGKEHLEDCLKIKIEVT